MKRGSWRVAFWLALSCSCASFLCAHPVSAKRHKGDAKKSVEALFARAKALENLMSPDTPPYLLRIRIVGVGQLGAYPEGSYTVRFLAPTQFRQDRVFGQWQFSAGANGDAKKQWSSQTTAHGLPTTSDGLLEAAFMFAASYAYDDPTAYGDPRSPELWRKNDFQITSRAEAGLTMTCAERRKPYWQTCFDATTGAVVAALDDSGLVFQYSNFEVWGTHLVPKQVIVFANRAPILEAQVVTLESLPADQAKSAAFAPPPGAKLPASPTPHCQAKQAHLIYEARPDYPHSAGSPAGDGTVGLWGMIDEAGKVSDVIVVQSAGPAFDHAAIEAVKQWRYSPLTICGEPSAFPSTFQVSFRP